MSIMHKSGSLLACRPHDRCAAARRQSQCAPETSGLAIVRACRPLSASKRRQREKDGGILEAAHEEVVVLKQGIFTQTG